jgi:MFS family permease
MVTISPISGRLSDKYGTRILCSIGLGIMAIGFVILIFIISNFQISTIIISQIILGLGIGLFSSPNQTAIMNSVERRDHGIAAGTLNTMRVAGQSMSVAILSAILTIFIPISILNPILSHKGIIIDTHIIALFTYGIQIAFLFSVIICLVGSIISLLRGKVNLNKI